MVKYHVETGKQAIWQGTITAGYKKWKNGEKEYYLNQKRITLYVPDPDKDEWKKFADDNKYSTLSKLIREAIKFFIDYKSKIINNVDINYLSSLSHDLKEPLTLIKAYLQLAVEKYGNVIDDDLSDMLKNIFEQSLALEKIIIEKLDPSDKISDSKMNERKEQIDILLIEDNLETLNFLTRYFSSLGYSCKGATSGTKGLKEMKKNNPKVILLDILLPDINGYEIIKKIRLSDLYKDIPVFFLTAMPSTEMKDKVKEFGATGLILKPFDLKDFKVIFKYLE